jgi:hypothetical protein
MIPMSITHTWLVLSLSCSDGSFLFGTSVLVDSSVLFYTQIFAIPTNYIFVLRETDQTLPLHESIQQHIAVDQCYS